MAPRAWVGRCRANPNPTRCTTLRAVHPYPYPYPYPNPNPNQVHDMQCHELGEEKRRRVGLYRPPSNSSIITHNLKRGGHTVAWELMQPRSTYDHRRCTNDWKKGKRAVGWAY